MLSASANRHLNNSHLDDSLDRIGNVGISNCYDDLEEMSNACKMKEIDNIMGRFSISNHSSK